MEKNEKATKRRGKKEEEEKEEKKDLKRRKDSHPVHPPGRFSSSENITGNIPKGVSKQDDSINTNIDFTNNTSILNPKQVPSPGVVYGEVLLGVGNPHPPPPPPKMGLGVGRPPWKVDLV